MPLTASNTMCSHSAAVHLTGTQLPRQPSGCKFANLLPIVNLSKLYFFPNQLLRQPSGRVNASQLPISANCKRTLLALLKVEVSQKPTTWVPHAKNFFEDHNGFEFTTDDWMVPDSIIEYGVSMLQVGHVVGSLEKLR